MRFLILKNKKNEMIAAKTILTNNLAPSGLLFIVEIIHDEFEYDKMTDSVTGELVRIPKECKDGVIRHYTTKDPSTQRNVTISKLLSNFPSQKVFIDYFRCDLRKYTYDAKNVSLVIEMNNQLNRYRKRLIELAKFDEIIPVISIKRGIVNFSPDELAKLIQDVRNIRRGMPFAVRIDDVDGYEKILENELSNCDFLFYDVGERPFLSLEMQYEELNNLHISANKVILCSPRKRDIPNKDFLHRNYATIIDNSASTICSQYGFSGYGDYGGLRDNLPKSIPIAGRALALLYCGSRREFKSYLCNNPKIGQKGFNLIVKDILADRSELDPLGDGYVFNDLLAKIDEGKSSTFQQWVQYTLIQYVQQIRFENDL